MALKLDSGAGASTARRGRFARYQPMSDINVTPLVDVVLVLLIVFMVTAPLLTVGVNVDLPKTDANEIEGLKEPVTVTIDKAGGVFVDGAEVSVDQIASKLAAITDNNYDERIYVRGDRNGNYGAVMRVMGTLSQAGFRHIALVAELDDRQ